MAWVDKVVDIIKWRVKVWLILPLRSKVQGELGPCSHVGIHTGVQPREVNHKKIVWKVLESSWNSFP